MRRIARGRGHFETSHDDLAIDPPQPQFEPPCTLPLPLELAGHVLREIGDHLVEQLTVADRLHQPALDQRHLLRDDRQQRFGYAAEQLVAPDQRVGRGRLAVAEPPLERIAPDLGDIAQPL